VKPNEFEQAVLDLAMTTSVPLTRANILFYSGAGARQADKWLDDMLRSGLLEFDSDDNGEIIYTVCGAKRPPGGPTQLTRCSACRRATGVGIRCGRCGQLLDPQLRSIRQDIERAGSALDLVRGKGGGLLPPQREGDKNLLVAGALGLLGPFGWFYAAPLQEAAAASAVFLLAYWLLPTILMVPLVSLLLPVSAVVGALYAYKHNRVGGRSGLFTEDRGA
jgi:hypothetical protein